METNALNDIQIVIIILVIYSRRLIKKIDVDRQFVAESNSDYYYQPSIACFSYFQLMSSGFFLKVCINIHHAYLNKKCIFRKLAENKMKFVDSLEMRHSDLKR